MHMYMHCGIGDIFGTLPGNLGYNIIWNEWTNVHVWKLNS